MELSSILLYVYYILIIKILLIKNSNSYSHQTNLKNNNKFIKFQPETIKLLEEPIEDQYYENMKEDNIEQTNSKNINIKNRNNFVVVENDKIISDDDADDVEQKKSNYYTILKDLYKQAINNNNKNEMNDSKSDKSGDIYVLDDDKLQSQKTTMHKKNDDDGGRMSMKQNKHYDSHNAEKDIIELSENNNDDYSDNGESIKKLIEHYRKNNNKEKIHTIHNDDEKTDNKDIKNIDLITDSKEATTNWRKKSPQDYGLKASSFFDLDDEDNNDRDDIIPDLIENYNKLNNPSQSELNNITYLIKKLGTYFNNNYMSINKPLYFDNNKTNIDNDIHNNTIYNYGNTSSYVRNKNGKIILLDKIPSYINNINFKYVYLNDGTKIRTKINNKLKKKIKQFLQIYTKCNISYKWKDLGIKFWPRYIKYGICNNNDKISCSIPSGMKCKPSKINYFTLLRYYCKNGSPCIWKNVQYPIVTDCSCSCP